MANRPTRSLKHEYELYVEQEIENYKESVPRAVLLSIGDDAVAALGRESQLALTELLLCEEVDRIIFRRLRLPSYTTWRRRQTKLLAELRRPEHWGLRPDDPVVRELQPRPDAHVLVAGGSEDSALYLAANGFEVTTVAREPDVVDRVCQAANDAGLGERVHALTAALGDWAPSAPLAAVIVSPAALKGLSASERARVIDALQSATVDGGVHLVKAIAQGQRTLSLEELRARYAGWMVTIDESSGRPDTFLARKQIS